MDIAKLLKNLRSQAVRIPRKFRLNAGEVSIRKHGNQLILTPISSEITLEKYRRKPTFPDFELHRTAGFKEQERELF